MKDILTCSLDGNCLSVIREDFIDLAESPSVFIKLYEEQIAEIKQLMNGDLKWAVKNIKIINKL